MWQLFQYIWCPIVVMWELFWYQVGPFSILWCPWCYVRTFSIPCGNISDTYSALWCYVGTIAILCGNFSDTYGCLTHHKFCKCSHLISQKLPHDTRAPLVSKKFSHSIEKVPTLPIFSIFIHITLKSINLEPTLHFSTFLFNVRTFSKLIVCNGCHVGTFAILCGNICETYGVHGVMW